MSVAGVGDLSGVGGGNSVSSAGPLTAAAALTALRQHPNTAVQISDTVQNILKSLDALQGFASKITSLTTGDTSQNLAVTGAQYQKDKAVLAVWGATSGQTVGITGLQASAVSTLGSYVTSLSVSDSSANIQRYLDSLQTAAASGVLSQIVQTGNPGTLTLTSAQLAADQTALDTIKNHGYTLAITNASVSDVLGLGARAALSTNAKVKSIAIVDTTDAISNNLDALQKVGLRVKSISQTDAATQLTVTGNQYQRDKSVLGKIITSDFLAVMDASTVQVKALAADHKVMTVDLHDSAANLSRNWALLGTLGNALTSVRVADQTHAISVSAAQLAASGTLLGKFTDTADQSYKLEVTGVSAAGAVAASQGHNVASVDVFDTGANVVAGMTDLQTLASQGKLSTITLSNARAPLSMDVSLLQGDQLTATQGVLDTIRGHNYTLAVTGATTSAIDDLAANKRVVSVAVGDTSANIEASLTKLHRLGGRLSTIEQLDTGAVFQLTQSELDAHASVLAKIAGGYSANLTGVTAAKATADARNVHVGSIAVSDTGRNILAHWNELRAIGTDLVSVGQTDDAALSVTADNYQVGVQDRFIAKFGQDTTFAVYGASAAQAQAINGDQAVSQIDVTETGQGIVDNLTSLATLAGGGKLHGITNQTPTVSLSLDASQLDDAQPVLDLIKGGSYTLALGGVDVGAAKDLVTNNHKIASVATTGSADDIVSNLADLNALGAKLKTITQTDAPDQTLDMTGDAFERNSAALAKINGGFLAVLSGVSAAKAAAFAASTSVSSVSVSDTGANLATAWGTLGDLGAKLTDVSQSDSSTLQLSADDWNNGQDLRGKFASDPQVSVSGADVSQVSDLASDSAVVGIQVSDTASALSDALSALAAESKVTQVVVQDPSVALTMSGQTYAASTSFLGLVKDGHYNVALSDVTASDASRLASDAHVASMNVSDSSAAVSAHFSALAAATNVSSIELSDQDGTVTLSAQQILGHPDTLAKLSGSYQLAATGVAMSDLADLADVSQTSSISISDTSANVSASFGDLLALGGTLAGVHLTDSSPVLSLSEQDWTAGASALATVDGSYQVDVGATVAGDAQALASNATVRNVSVADTASNIVSQWDTLVGLYNNGGGKLAGLSLTDTDPLVLTSDQQTAGAAMITALLPDETIQTAS